LGHVKLPDRGPGQEWGYPGRIILDFIACLCLPCFRGPSSWRGCCTSEFLETVNHTLAPPFPCSARHTCCKISRALFCAFAHPAGRFPIKESSQARVALRRDGRMARRGVALVVPIKRAGEATAVPRRRRPRLLPPHTTGVGRYETGDPSHPGADFMGWRVRIVAPTGHERRGMDQYGRGLTCLKRAWGNPVPMREARLLKCARAFLRVARWGWIPHPAQSQPLLFKRRSRNLIGPEIPGC